MESVFLRMAAAPRGLSKVGTPKALGLPEPHTLQLKVDVVNPAGHSTVMGQLTVS